MFIHLVIFIYKYFKFLIFILLLRFPSFGGFASFCCSGGHPYTVDISLRYRRYLISALHTQTSAESTYAVSAVLATPSVQLRYQLIFLAIGYAWPQACGLPYMRWLCRRMVTIPRILPCLTRGSNSMSTSMAHTFLASGVTDFFVTSRGGSFLLYI